VRRTSRTFVIANPACIIFRHACSQLPRLDEFEGMSGRRAASASDLDTLARYRIDRSHNPARRLGPIAVRADEHRTTDASTPSRKRIRSASAKASGKAQQGMGRELTSGGRVYKSWHKRSSTSGSEERTQSPDIADLDPPRHRVAACAQGLSTAARGSMARYTDKPNWRSSIRIAGQ